MTPRNLRSQRRKHRTMESVISPVCALRVIKTRGHSLPGRLRQRGASGPGLLCRDCLDVLSPCISLTTSDTRLHSTRAGTNVSLCGSEGPSRSDGIKSKRTPGPTERASERAGWELGGVGGFSNADHAAAIYLSLSATSAGLLSQLGEWHHGKHEENEKRWQVCVARRQRALLRPHKPPTSPQPQPQPHHCCFYICSGVGLLNIRRKSRGQVPRCQIV